MDFDLSEEQRLLKESVDGLLNSSYTFDQRKKYGAEKGGWSKSVWGKLAEQGWPCQGTSSASRGCVLHTPLPPYATASLLRASR